MSYRLRIFLSLLSLALAACQTEEVLTDESLGTALPEVSVSEDPGFKDARTPWDLDFSRVGYRWSDRDIPVYPVGRAISPSDVGEAIASGEAPDTTTFLEQALEALPDGTALLLKEGDYHVHRAVIISKSNVVLRGEGADKTRIVAKAVKSADVNKVKYTCLALGLPYKVTYGQEATVTDSHVPFGAMYCNVDTPDLFVPGDRVEIYRPATQEWLSAIRMDCIDDPVHTSWPLADFDMQMERIVTAVSGHRIYFDAPVPMDLDACYGGAKIRKCTVNRISESGIEDLALVAEYDPSVVCTAELDYSSFRKYGAYECDENHAKSGIWCRAAEHCWIKGVTGKHFLFATVSLQKGSRNITVSDCHSKEPRSLITGSRRYAFVIGKNSALNLIKDCTADKDRHMFVTPNRAEGPHVFLRCKGTNCYSNAGPHCWWAVYVLYDNLEVDNKLSVEDVGGEANESSHGWQGTNHVLWNCTATSIVCHSPWVTGRNWAWGCVGTKVWGSYFKESPRDKDPSTWVYTDKWRLDGDWNPALDGGQTNSVRMEAESLFETQLAARHAAGDYVMAGI